MARRFWFRAKTYGWGWTPASWEGWAVTLADLAAILGWCGYLFSHPALRARSDNLLITLVPILLAVAILILICWLKGERPRWRWGK